MTSEVTRRDDTTWFLHYAVINTGILLNNKKVLIVPFMAGGYSG
jgi:hypothetical protein